jgi:hypothetical protein
LGDLDRDCREPEDFGMKAIIELDPDIEGMIRQQMQTSHRTLAEEVNVALRSTLGTRTKSSTGKRRFKVKARPLGLRCEPEKLNDLIGEIEIASLLETMNHGNA